MRRLIGRSILLLALFIAPLALSAQEESADDITVVGSGVVVPLVESFATSAEIAINASITGTVDGFEAFCSGNADIVAVPRAISAEEEGICQLNGINFAELFIGSNVVAFVTSPATESVQCLNAGELGTIFAPSSEGQIDNWALVDLDYAVLPLSLYLPPADTAAYALIDNQVEGVGLRGDVNTLSSDAEIIEAVSQTPGAVGVVSLAAAQNAGETVKILELSNVQSVGCAAPSAESVEDRLYPAAERLFIYTNAASLENAGVQSLLNAAVSDAAAETLTAAGFTAPTAEAYQRGRDIVQNRSTGRQFSLEVTEFVIPPTLFGQVNMGGSAEGYSFFESATTQFTTQYSSVTVNLDMQGEPAGFRRFCNGELDIAVAFNDLNEEQAANCTANNITPVSFELGREAVVLVANAGSEYLACLTPEQLATTWSATSADSVTTWNQVSEGFAEEEIFLFSPQGNSSTDLLMSATAGGVTPQRSDVAEANNDALYRAAATANVAGALTYMSWPEYQDVLENEQANIQLVGIGENCVQPSEETIADGTYPLTRTLKLFVNQTALSRSEVQSVLWFLFNDQNYTSLVNAGFVGLSFGDLPEFRNQLQTAFDEAAVQAAIDAQATPEATSEAGEQATEEAGAAATEQATEAPVEAEPTEQATEASAETEATAEPTAEATESNS